MIQRACALHHLSWQSKRCFSTDAQPLITLLSKLRTETQAPISECRDALLRANNDYKSALEHVREYLLERGKAAIRNIKKEDLKASTVFFSLLAGRLSISELASETDFVSSSAQFIAMGHEAANVLHDANAVSPHSADVAALNEILSPLLSKYSSIFGEKLQLLDYYSCQFPFLSQTYGYYMHQSLGKTCSDAEGRIQDAGSMFSLVAFENGFGECSSQLPRQIAQHILANNPDSIEQLGAEDGPSTTQESLNGSGKNLLLNQRFLFDEGKSIREVLENNALRFFLVKQKGLQVKFVAK